MARQRHGRRSVATSAALADFTSVNRQFRSFATNAQSEYESGLISRLKENPKLLHSHIRKLKVGRPSVGPLRVNDGETSDDPTTMAECLASAFASVYTQATPDNPMDHQVVDATLDDVPITIDAVLSVLKQLDSNSAMGPDGLHPLLLKSCAGELAYPLFWGA